MSDRRRRGRRRHSQSIAEEWMLSIPQLGKRMDGTAACTTLILAAAPHGAGRAVGRSESGRHDDHRHNRFLNQYMFRGIRQNTTGSRCGHSWTWASPPIGRRRLQERWASTSARGTACTPAIRAPTTRAASVVRIRLLRDARRRVRRRSRPQHHLHGLHQPEQQLHDVKEIHVQARSSMTARVSAGRR